MDCSIEIIEERPSNAKSNLNFNEIKYDNFENASTSSQKPRKRATKKVAPTLRPKSARQRTQVVFLEEEQQQEENERKLKKEIKLAKQKMGCDEIFVEPPEINTVRKKKKVLKRKSSGNFEDAPPLKKRAPQVKKIKTEVGGAGSLKCKKITNDEDCQIIFEWDPAKVISERQGVLEWQTRNVIELFEQENTLPFIARYRKEKTGNLEVEKLREIQNSYSQLKTVQEKVVKVLKNVEMKIPQDRRASLLCATSVQEVEHLTAVYKTASKKTLSERAKNLGLLDVSLDLLQTNQNKYVYCNELQPLLNPSKEGLRIIEEVEQGIQHIIADFISKESQVLECIKKLIESSRPKIECNKARRVLKKDTTTKTAKSSKTTSKGGKSQPTEDICSKYEHYFNYNNYAWNVKSHEILAMNRGEQQGVLSVRVVISDNAYLSFFNFCQQKWLSNCPAHYYRAQLVMKSVEDSWQRLVKPFMQRQIRSRLTEKAEIGSVEVFANNLKKLLLSPPVRGSTVLAIDPGFTNGCKIGVTNPQGEKLLTTTIYPFKGNNHENHWTNDHNAKTLREIVNRYGCEIFAIGNGCGCRKVETYISNLIRDKCFEPYNVKYTIIDETGVSQYSITTEAKQELPGLDPNHISAVSLARRLQDPLLEYVKVHPMHLGVGMYQHDIPEKLLHNSLDSVVTECVSFVGVDINVASEFVLRKLAGLNKARASHVIEYRKSVGPFVNREQIKQVKGIGPKTYEQCAGFIKVLPETLEALALKSARHRKRLESERLNPLDMTIIHPESYNPSQTYMSLIGLESKDVGSQPFIQKVQQFMQKSSLQEVAEKCNVSTSVMQTIIEGLTQPLNFDLRARFSEPLFRKGVTSIDDVKVGTCLTGTVRNVTDFGSFVDIGVGRDGLIHKSNMGRVILELGHVVEVNVVNLNQDKSRIGLALKNVIR